MKTRIRCIAVVFCLFLIVIVGCGRDEPATETADNTAVAAKLTALDEAREAGILSEDEYNRKRKEALAAADSGRQAKRQALDDALAAGIISEQEYKAKLLDLQGGGTPLSGTLATASPATAGALPTPTAAMPPKEAGKTYRHASGFSFWYPATWKLQDQQEFLQLIPPNAGTSPEGPTEIYIVSGESVAGEGISSAVDPWVGEYLDMQVSSIAPFLTRADKPKAVHMASGQGGQFDWSGMSPAGKQVVARSYVAIVGDLGVILSAICFPDRLQAREKEIERIFASFAFAEGKKDPQLVGNWDYLTTQSTTNWSPFETSYSRAQLASDHTGKLEFRPDGTWTRTDRTHMIAGAGGVWLEDKSEKVNRGRWFADGKQLMMVWEDNSWEDYDYQIKPSPDGQRLLLSSGKNGELWQRSR